MKGFLLFSLVLTTLFGTLCGSPVAFAAPVEEVPMSRVSDDPLMCMAVPGVKVVRPDAAPCPTEQCMTEREPTNPTDVALQSPERPTVRGASLASAVSNVHAETSLTPESQRYHWPPLDAIGTVVLRV